MKTSAILALLAAMLITLMGCGGADTGMDEFMDDPGVQQEPADPEPADPTGDDLFDEMDEGTDEEEPLDPMDEEM